MAEEVELQTQSGQSSTINQTTNGTSTTPLDDSVPDSSEVDIKEEAVAIAAHVRRGSTIGIHQYKENEEHAIVFQDLSYSITKWTKQRPFRKEMQILHDISGYIPQNCICGIIGASGAGKTTLLGLLAGIPKSGKKEGVVSVCSKNIAFVSQVPHIAPTETVHEVLSFACSVTYYGASEEEKNQLNTTNRTAIISNRVDKVLHTLNLSRVTKRQIRFLSGGELKRVSIAMQLMTYPDILVLDVKWPPFEPTSGLDTPNALSIIQTLKRVVQSMNCTVVMSIHQPHKRICDCMDWILSLKDGFLLYQGPLPESFVCRDVQLNDIKNIFAGRVPDYKPVSADSAEEGHPDKPMTKSQETGSLPVADSSEDAMAPSYAERNSQSQEADKKQATAPLITNYHLDTKLLQTLSSMYNVDLIRNGTEIHTELLVSLINDIMKDGHNTANAADYLLETEYLSTTQQLHDNWVTYRDKKYPTFASKLMDSISMNMTFQINNCIGCDVAEYCREFAHCSTYVHAMWAFLGLSARTFRYYWRKWWMVLFNIIVSVLAAVVLGLIYGEMTDQQKDIQNRFGAFGFMCIFIGIQAVASAGSFHEVRDVFIDDRNAKLYGSTPFLLARTVPDLLLLRIAPAVCFAVIFFEMLGFQEHTFGEFMAVAVLLSCASSLCVFAISSLMPDAYSAGFVAIFLNMILMLYGGVFIQDETAIPAYVRWPKWFSFYNFAFEILMVNEFSGMVFDIDESSVNGLSVGPLEISGENLVGLDIELKGEFFLAFFGMNPDDVPLDWTLLFVWIVAYFLVAWIALELLYRAKR